MLLGVCQYSQCAEYIYDIALGSLVVGVSVVASFRRSVADALGLSLMGGCIVFIAGELPAIVHSSGPLISSLEAVQSNLIRIGKCSLFLAMFSTCCAFTLRRL